MGVDAVREMKVWPFGAALRGEASNHHMLRWLNPTWLKIAGFASVLAAYAGGARFFAAVLFLRRDA